MRPPDTRLPGCVCHARKSDVHGRDGSLVALLRGVNVGGVTIRTADLRAAVPRHLGFDEVRTVLASGNVGFETDAAPRRRATLKPAIETALCEALRLRRVDRAGRESRVRERDPSASRSTRGSPSASPG